MRPGEVAIVSVGYSGFWPVSPHLSYKELTFEAARRACSRVNIDPRTEVDTFLACEEDLNEGTSITDEYAPDQMGAAQRPVCTVTSDGLNCVAQAAMQISSGIGGLAMVEGHIKYSNIKTKGQVSRMALDPYLEREFLSDCMPLAALEMRRYMHKYSVKEEDIALVAVKNKRNGMRNPKASFGGNYTTQEIMGSKEICPPLRQLYISQPADGAVVVILASSEKARQLCDNPVWIEGIGWFTDSPLVGLRDLEDANYARGAARMAYKMAAIDNPRKQIEFAEVDDTLAHKELQHLEALGIYDPGKAADATRRGETMIDGSFPVNLSGGSLAMGDLAETSALVRLAEAFETIRSGRFKRGVVQSWRGLPAASGSAVVLGA